MALHPGQARVSKSWIASSQGLLAMTRPVI
jgi:hypothetical protein